MSGPTKIEWTERTWSPVRGCVKVSPGCKNCYAEAFAERFRGVPGHPYEQGFDPRLALDQLDAPLRWRKPATIFVNSMSDIFGEFVPFRYLAAVFGVMSATPRHVYQVLTKRAERVPLFFEWLANVGGEHGPSPTWICETEAVNHCAEIDQLEPPWPLSNVHLGVSVEDRRYGLPRIEHLRRVPAALRFLSIEPLLEDLGDIDLTGIGWVIVGGESGPGARSCDLSAVRRVVAQAREQHVPVFVKQLGAVPVFSDRDMRALRPKPRRLVFAGTEVALASRKGGDPAEWPEDLRIREMPARSA